MDFSDAFRLVNLATGVIMVLGGISQFFPVANPSSSDVMLLSSDFVCCSLNLLLNTHTNALLRAGTALLEFQIPPQLSRYASFLFSFLGRGIFYIFVGSILLHDGPLRIIAGSIVGLIGVAYVALEFVPSIEPPANMREADGGWGAEQV
ncbi:COPI associated protein [Rutstroemia sp. NJR-2017a WRK4]|nr:COPI associated protein [Rutstroemia sp. NJR-2017a WRK4]